MTRTPKIVSFFCLLLAGSASFAHAKETIEYWEKWTGEEGAVMAEIVEDFNNSQDRIHVRYTTVSQIDQKLLLAVLGKSPPDVAGLWAPFVAPYSERGIINPIDSLFAEAGFDFSSIDPAVATLCRHKERVWALPSSSMALMLYSNSQIFLENGISPDFQPKSFEELMELSKRLTLVKVARNGETATIPFTQLEEEELQNRDYELVRLGFDPAVSLPWIPYFGIWFGNSPVDSEGAIDYAAAGLRESLDWYRSFFELYGIEPLRRFGSSYGGFSSATNPFYSGRVAMMLNGPWVPRFLAEYAPGLEWEVSPMPTANGDTATLLDTDILVIPRGSKNPKAAMEFIRYVLSPEISERLNIAQSKMSPLASRSSRFITQHPNKKVESFYRVADEAAFPIYQSPLFSRIISDLYTAYDQASFSFQRADQFLQEAQERIDRKGSHAAERWAQRGERLMRLGNLR